MAPAPEPERYPFHDNDECPEGLDVKAHGEWQYYAPSQVAETRARCPLCTRLGAGKAGSTRVRTPTA